jgi:hypothetical protein
MYVFIYTGISRNRMKREGGRKDERKDDRRKERGKEIREKTEGEKTQKKKNHQRNKQLNIPTPFAQQAFLYPSPQSNPADFCSQPPIHSTVLGSV